MDLLYRPRRLRSSARLRKMVRETRVDKSSLIYPMFVTEGTNVKEEIPSMAGQYRYSVDRMEEKLTELAEAGVGGVMLFGIPDHKDEIGSGAYAEDGIVQKGFRKAKEVCPELYLIGELYALGNYYCMNGEKEKGIPYLLECREVPNWHSCFAYQLCCNDLAAMGL